MSGVTLYDIEARRKDLFEKLTSEDPKEAEQAELELIAIEEVRDEKLTNCVAWHKNLSAEIEILEAEISRLKDRKKKAESKLERFSEYITRCLGAGESWSNAIHRLSYRKSKSVEIADYQAIPLQFIKQKVVEEADKQLIRETIEGGGEVPGAVLKTNFNLQVR